MSAERRSGDEVVREQASVGHDQAPAGRAEPSAQREQSSIGRAEPSPQREEGRVISRLTDELVPVLISRLEASALGELEVRQNGWRVRLRRPLNVDGTLPSDEPLIAPRSGEEAGAPEPRHTAQRRERRSELTSPAVGYFVPRDGLAAGMIVRNGEVVGHIDVLGVRQEVVAPIDARLTRLEVAPGQAVEYGQPIARLEPEARS